MSPELFSINLYHGGYFTHPPGRLYVNGIVDFSDLLNVDHFGLPELDVIKERLGYTNDVPCFFHFMDPNGDLDTTLYPLAEVEDVSNMLSFVREGEQYIDVYMEHGLSNIQIFSEALIECPIFRSSLKH